MVVVALGIALLGESLAPFNGKSFPESLLLIAALITEKWTAAPLNFLIGSGKLVLAVLYGTGWVIYARRAAQFEKLTFDAVGIQFESPLPAWLRWLRPSWRMAWSEITCAQLIRPTKWAAPTNTLLVIEGGGKRRTIFPLAWCDPQGVERRRRGWWHLLIGDAKRSAYIRGQLDASPILTALAHAGVHVDSRTGPQANTGYALEKNPYSRTAVVLFFVFLLYFLVDLTVGAERYAVAPDIQWFVLTAIVTTVAAVLWLTRGKVPRAEGVTVAFLTGAAFAAALYPGMLRLNQITDTLGLFETEYRAEGLRVFKAVDRQLPTLTFSDNADEYWAQFKPGDKHRFQLRKGGLGFYQVNMAPIHARMRAFYNKSS